MTRKTILASVLAVALAFGQATPAAAAPDAEDYVKVILGVIALGAIAKAIEDDRKEEAVAPAPSVVDPIYRDDWRRDERGRHSRRYTLPARCEFDTRTRHGGWKSVFGRHCLEREGVRVHRLPQACEFDIRTDRGTRTVYGSRCLRENGYTVEARRR